MRISFSKIPQILEMDTVYPQSCINQGEFYLGHSLQRYNDCLWRTSRDRNSTKQRSSPWLAIRQYEMLTSVHSIDRERLHHRVSHWVYRPMGMRKQEWQTDRPRYLFCSNRPHYHDAVEKKQYHIAATTFCQGANSKSKLSVYCRYLSGRLWWGDVFRLESSSLRPRCSYIQTGIGSPAL